MSIVDQSPKQTGLDRAPVVIKRISHFYPVVTNTTLSQSSIESYCLRLSLNVRLVWRIFHNVLFFKRHFLTSNGSACKSCDGLMTFMKFYQVHVLEGVFPKNMSIVNFTRITKTNPILTSGTIWIIARLIELYLNGDSTSISTNNKKKTNFKTPSHLFHVRCPSPRTFTDFICQTSTKNVLTEMLGNFLRQNLPVKPSFHYPHVIVPPCSHCRTLVPPF